MLSYFILFILFSNFKEIRLREVAFGKSCQQSSNEQGLITSEAVDGDLNTYMNTKLDQSPYWIVDLGKPYQIKQIEIFNRKHGDIATGELRLSIFLSGDVL